MPATSLEILLLPCVCAVISEVCRQDPTPDFLYSARLDSGQPFAGLSSSSSHSTLEKRNIFLLQGKTNFRTEYLRLALLLLLFLPS